MATLLKAIIAGMFQTIADVAPAFKVEVEAFDAIGAASAYPLGQGTRPT
jgi:hypothetical protein